MFRSKLTQLVKYTRSIVTEVENIVQFNELKEKSDQLLLQYSADWCSPCRMIKPHVESLSEAFPSVVFAKVDIGELPDLQDNVKSVPTFKLYIKGIIVETTVGADPKRLEAAIKKNFKTST
eukprot:GHVL01033724.1.p1 GENE.GHVL01033724.1~~GHVL01033724.1.p1  ORF type:complete len:121 (-),score=11.86 GHVL01033724.1:52-414(-)